ncbi:MULTISPECIES: hypothetical protein [unclassified Acinetobacter]|uniref:hypothetical protein n=1 Tax=unclassified Acinetobacter TaxID=196816 RepID=UPI0015D143DE|nr:MULTISPECIES: hypothetical protein [unclassified Acinetobacter]
MKIQTTLFGELVLLTECTLVGSSESLGFQTFINTSHNGTEKRKALRETASQVLNIDYVVARRALAQNFNVLWGGLRKLWAIPVDYEWQDVEAVSGDFISCDTSVFDFRSDSLAVLKHADGHTVVEILEVRPDGLKLYDPVDIPASKLCPLRVGFILGDVSAPINAVYGQPSLQFQIMDAPYLNAPAPSQFLGRDIYFKRLLLEGDSLNVSLVQHQTIVDFGFGPIDQHTNWLHARYGKPMRSVMKTQQELFEYKQFLFRRLGQYREFWLPTFERNFYLKSTGTISTVIDVELNQYQEYASNRKHIAIQDKSGNWTAHSISNAVQTSNTLRLTITPALNKAAVDIRMISYLGLHRLNNDSVDIQYKGAGITESSVAILEIEP